MHQNLHGQEAQDLFIKSMRFGLSEKALIGNVVLARGHPSMLFLDAGSSDRTVTLPAEEIGLFFDIFNRSTTNRLTVQDDAGATVAVVYPRHSVQFVSTKDDWESFGHIFGEAGASHKPGLVPDPGATDNVGVDTLYLTENGWAALGAITTNDFFKNITDGTNTAVPVGADTFKLRSSDSSLTVTVTNNEAVHGDNVNLVVNEANVDHDALLNFVANEHIDHSTVNVNTAANSGLAGGGTIAASRSLALDINNLSGIVPVLGDSFAFYDLSGTVTGKATLTSLNAILDHDALVNFSANEHIDHTAVSISAGPGLSGGGDISASRTISLDITGQSGAAPASGDELIYWDVSESDFDKMTVLQLNGALAITSLSGYVANEHINHTLVTLTAGAGLTGGGDISANRTLDVGAGTGITVNANDVAINQAFTPTWTGAHRFQSYLDIDEIAAPANPAANIARFYSKDNGSGITKLYFRDSAGSETALGSSSVLAKEVFTASGTFITPSNSTTSTLYKFTITGGGGGGGGVAQSGAGTFSAAGSGGAAATTIWYVSGLSPNTGYTVTVGAGGGGGAAGNNNGSAGGQSSVQVNATTATAPGGGGGAGAPANSGAQPGAGGAAGANGTIMLAGGGGGAGVKDNTSILFHAAGGNSIWGGGAGFRVGNGAGVVAGAYGSGGGAGLDSSNTVGGFAGAAGSGGIVVVEWVI